MLISVSRGVFMPKTKSTFVIKENDSLFVQRFKELCGEDTNSKQVAQLLNANGIVVTDQSIRNWLQGISEPAHSTVYAIAKLYKVNINWLLGISDIQTPIAALEDVCNYTGLSLEAVEALHKYNDNLTYTLNGKQEKGAQLSILSKLIEANVIQSLADYTAELERNSKALLNIDSVDDETYHSIYYLNDKCDVTELKINKLLSQIEKHFDERERQSEKYKELKNKQSEHIDKKVTFKWKTEEQKDGE